MEIIQHPDSTFQELMDFKRDMRDENCHPSSFVISREVPEGLLLFQTLTCEMVLACKPGDILDYEPDPEGVEIIDDDEI